MLPSVAWRSLVLLSLFHGSDLQRTTVPPPHWDYEREGPDAWHHLFDTCEGDAQSPINIQTPRVRYNSQLAPLSLNGYNANMSSFVWNFTHNGHTIVAYPPPMTRLSISGGGLPDVFYLLQFHSHWGYNAYQGSEHTINDRKYPLEVHFVHRSSSTGTLAVLGILFDLQREDNPYLNELLSALNRTHNTSVSFEQQADISRLFPTSPSPRFYRYNGSLTTPPCTEGVIWTLLKKTVPISSYQLRVFTGNTVPFNFRPPQRLHSRKVVANFQPEPMEGEEGEEGEGAHHSSALSTTRLPLVSFILTSSAALVSLLQ